MLKDFFAQAAETLFARRVLSSKTRQSSSRRQRRRPAPVSRSMQVETLEQKQLLAVDVTMTTMPEPDFTMGPDQSAVAAEVSLYTDGPDSVAGIDLDTHDGSGGVQLTVQGDVEVVESIDMYLDLFDDEGNWSPDGVYETHVGSGTPDVFGQVHVDTQFSIFGSFVTNRGWHAQFVANTADNIQGDVERQFTLTRPVISEWGTSIDWSFRGVAFPEVTVTGNPVQNQAPVANDDAVAVSSIFEEFDILANDTDPDGDPLDVSSVDIVRIDSNAFNSVAVSNLTGLMSFQPRAGFTGQTEVVYTVDDIRGATSNEAVITVDVLPATQGLTVSLSDDNSIGDTVARGGTFEALSVEFTAGASPVLLENLTLLHYGFGDNQDIESVFASIDGTRATRPGTFDSEDQTVDLRLNPPASIDPYETITIDLSMQLSASAAVAGEHGIMLELPSDVVSNAPSVSGAFPFRGNTFRVAAVSSGTIDVEYRTVSPDQLEVGDTDVVIGKFALSVNSVEDQTIYQITTEEIGTAGPFDYENIVIERTDGTVLTDVAGVSHDGLTTFVFSPPFTILEGDIVTVQVTADIVGGAGETIRQHIEHPIDVFAVGSLYGYGVNGQLYPSQVVLPTPTPSLPDTVHITAGEITFDFDGPASQDYTRDDNDAVLGNLVITTGNTADVRDLFAQVTAVMPDGSAVPEFVHNMIEDFEIRNTRTGRTIDAVRLVGADHFDESFQRYRFNDFIVQTGRDTWEVRGDFIDNGPLNHPLDGVEFYVEVCASVNSCTFTNGSNTTVYNADIQNLQGDPLLDVRPDTTIRSNSHTIASASLAIAEQQLVTTDTAVEGERVLLGRFSARAGDAEDTLLTRVEAQVVSGIPSDFQNFTLVWAGDNGDVVLESGVASLRDRIVFNDLAGGGFVIPAEHTESFEIWGHGSRSFSGTTYQVSLRDAQAEELDDGSSIHNIVIHNVPQTLFNLQPSGSTAIVNSTAIAQREHQVPMGDVSDFFGAVDVHAFDEGVNITNWKFGVNGAGWNSVKRFEFLLQGETDPFAFATIAGCGNDPLEVRFDATFCASMNSNELEIGADETQTVFMRILTKTDLEGGLPGQPIDVTLSGAAVVDPFLRVGPVIGEFVTSTDYFIANDGDNIREPGELLIGTFGGPNQDITFPTLTTVSAGFANIANASSDDNGDPIPLGQSDLGVFEFTTLDLNNGKDGDDDAEIGDLIVSLHTVHTVIAAGSVGIYNTDDPSTVFFASQVTDVSGNPIVGDITESALLWFEGIDTSRVNSTIDPSDNIRLAVQASVTDANSSTNGEASALQLSLDNFTDPREAVFGALGSHLSWNIDDGNDPTDVDGILWADLPFTTVRGPSYVS